MADAQARVAEAKAAHVVRRAIHKLRLATPENYDTLEAEAFDCMEQQLVDMGSQHERIQEELEKALEAGRARVQQTLERRAQEEELAAEPRAIMEDVRMRIATLKTSIDELARAARIGASEAPRVDEVAGLASRADALAAEVRAFSTQAVAQATAMKEAVLPETVKAAWTKLAHEVVQVKSRGETVVVAAKAAGVRAAEAERKDKLEARKAAVRKVVEEASAAVPAAEHFVVKAEVIVEPFVKGRRREEAELAPLCDAAEEAVAAARSQCKSANQEMQTALVSAEAEVDDELLRKDVGAFVAAESKVPRMRLGQYERRLQRVVNIVRRYRKEVRTIRNRSLFVSLREELLERVKGNGESRAFDDAEPQLVEAERQVAPLGRHRRMSVDDMRDKALAVQAAIDSAREALASASYAVIPVDDSLDEDLKKKLRATAAPLVKRPVIKLGQLERRMVRVVNLLATFRKAIARKELAGSAAAQTAARKLLQKHLQQTSPDAEALFDELCDGMPGLDEPRFLTFFMTLAQEATIGGLAGPETVALAESDLRLLHKCLRKPGEPLLGKADFLQLATPRLRVAKPTMLTSELGIGSGKILRALRLDEALDILEGPLRDGKSSASRARVKAELDGREGWATVAGASGTVFLKESAS